MCGACCFPRYRPTIQSAHFARIPRPGSSNGVRVGTFMHLCQDHFSLLLGKQNLGRF